MSPPARIPEGFRAQHLVVLPAAVRRRAQSHPLLRGLLVTDAGVFPRAASHYIARPRGAPTSLVLICTSGRGWAEFDGTRQPVSAGTLVWFPAEKPHAYGSDDAAPWTVEWAHFTGDEVLAWADLLGFPRAGGTLPLASAAASELRLARVWAHLERGYSLANLTAASAELRATFATAARTRPSASSTRSAAERVAASAEWMKLHLAQSLRLEELASAAALSVPHYSALFRQQTGFSPIDWLIRLRVQRACQLLDTTADTIASIGQQVGFADAFYFTRCFRRVMGTPPRTYRSVPKG